MQIVHARESLPASVTQTIFLAGPTPRSASVEGWRGAALAELERQGFTGTVLVPEPRDGVWAPVYEEQVEWEEAALHAADCILFWIPRDMETLPGLTTNVEWGTWASSGKVVLGAPPGAAQVRYLLHYADKLRVPVASDVAGVVAAAIRSVGEGALRTGGERDVPLHVWRHPTFQGWYRAQQGAGHRLEQARVLWSYFAGAERAFFFAWALRVTLLVPGEGRQKRELVLGRTDVCSVLLYRRGATLFDTEVVLVREVRAAARTADGMVHELPGGSSWSPGEEAISVALHEVEEETGFRPAALAVVGARQLAATLLAHEATLFAAELSAGDMEGIRAGLGRARGVAEDGERTYTELRTVREILAEGLADWTTVGMILATLAPLFDGSGAG
jgi:Nucleoside 2-deoxyribosyltransferase like/NUDIX domain